MSEPTSAEEGSVLIVEDNEGLADLTDAWLNDVYLVQVAYNGEEALDIVDSTIDIVLLDRRMPGISGDEVLKIIRDQDLQVYVVMVSAVSPGVDIIGMGFDDYITKPVTEAEILEVVERLHKREKYADPIEELVRLLRTKALLEREISNSDLQRNDEYSGLVEQITDRQEQVDIEPGDFEGSDIEAEFADL